jgi:hypothetical protein
MFIGLTSSQCRKAVGESERPLTPSGKPPKAAPQNSAICWDGRGRVVQEQVQELLANQPGSIYLSIYRSGLICCCPQTVVGFRFWMRNSTISIDLANDHLIFGKKSCARLAMLQPKNVLIQAYFQDNCGTPSCPPRSAAICFT